MKNKFITTLAIIGFYTIGLSQINPKILLGNWVLQGTEISGTLYYANEWNKETLTLNDDYSFVHSISTYEDKTILTQEIKGQWLFSKDSLSLVLFANQDRFQKDVNIKTIYKEIAIYFANEHFLSWKENTQRFTQLKRFKREDYNGNFEEELLAYQHEQALKNKTLDLEKYWSIKGNDTIQKKYATAYVTFRNVNRSYSDYFHYQKQMYDGRITKITDTSVFVQPLYVFKKNLTKRNSTQREFEFFNGKSSMEIQKRDIQYIHQPLSSLGMKTSLGLTAASAFTTLVIAPIVGLASNQNGRKHYVNTAGVGLIGVGTGIGSYFIFRAIKKKMNSKDKDAVKLIPKYLVKS